MYIHDLHCHLLPGLDDGAFLEEESLQMAQLASERRTRSIVCTPHRSPEARGSHELRKLLETFHRICTLIRSHNLPLKLFLGQEIFLCEDDPSYAADLEKGMALTINRSVYPLVEFHPDERADAAFRMLKRLTARGFVPIIAHPERYRFVKESRETSRRLRSAGALLQIDKDSLTGLFGSSAQRTAHRLLYAREADFIASDAHSPYLRTTDLHGIHEWVSEHCSMEYADLLLCINPAHVLRNEKTESL